MATRTKQNAVTVKYGKRTLIGESVHTELAFSDGSTGRMTWLGYAMGTTYTVEARTPGGLTMWASSDHAMDTILAKLGARA